ncbi:hypothetical protein [Spirosoma fluviale]|uniref:Uncharacterized protein n=1 Tax=Spirosoma fluviale TaxID=1597977 RepID=A0A286GA58_9BACT|nr:hypothetical protein [Spirosoma fluviale]SOD92417.1 hypothetical protein SAMN06269250_3968 [Spirosoma fluviale]
MQTVDTEETPVQTGIKMVVSLLLAVAMFVGLALLLFGAYLLFNRVPDADVNLSNVARDTTFYVGTAESTGGGSDRISILATGALDDSTASIRIEYTKPAGVAGEFQLHNGNNGQVFSSDFYDSKAKVTYRHRGVKQGHLRLQIKLTDPPKEWGYKWHTASATWVKVR